MSRRRTAAVTAAHWRQKAFSIGVCVRLEATELPQLVLGQAGGFDELQEVPSGRL